MKKKIISSNKGRRADIDDLIIYRILPNKHVRSVGPFVFFDHIALQVRNQTEETPGTSAHPHRGIATLSYILQGLDTHYDSAGHFAKVASGGIQWMKSGKGVIHDETLVADPDTSSPFIHGYQFWINLPAENKVERPDYLAIQADKVPTRLLGNAAGRIKVIAGSYEESHSIIPNYSEQFLYHIILNAGSHFMMETNQKLEYGAFLPDSDALINDANFYAGEFISFANDNGKIEIVNTNDEAINILVFGGAPYTEPIVAEGPFVMNSHEELAEAYRDFHLGKYGKIKYNNEPPR